MQYSSYCGRQRSFTEKLASISSSLGLFSGGSRWTAATRSYKNIEWFCNRLSFYEALSF
jgi:hypothetical protein